MVVFKSNSGCSVGQNLLHLSKAAKMRELVSKFEDYLLLEKNYSILTVKAYGDDLVELVSFFELQFDLQTWKELNYSCIRSFIVNRVDNGLSNRSINRKISSLRTFIRFLMKVGELDSNPLAKHQPLKVAKRLQLPFSEVEVFDVLDSFSEASNYDDLLRLLIVELFYGTGMRRAELISLKVQSIDMQTNTIRILGKRNKERIVPLLEVVKKTLVKYLAVRPQISGDLLLVSEKGVKISESFVYRTINTYFSNVSAKAKKSPHILRHSFATHLLNNGADLNSVKELLGHASLASTQVYTHSSLAELQKVFSKTHPRSSKT
jgi:integrase/recombinase XerC